MKDSLYFPHDYFARFDPKLVEVMMAHGMAGIGVFWCIIEMMYEQGGTLPTSSFKSIAFALHVDCNMVASVVNDFGLFIQDGENFTSPSVNNRINRRVAIAEKCRENAQKRWAKSKSNANASETDANAEQPECICNAMINNKSKGKNKDLSSKDDSGSGKRSTFTPPTIEEVKQYLDEKQITNVDAERFVLFYESKGWMIGKNKMKSWKAAVATWAKSEKERPAARRTSSSESTKSANDPWT